MRGESPIEWTNEAHLVTTGCEVCDASLTVPGDVARGGVTCEDCQVAEEGDDE